MTRGELADRLSANIWADIKEAIPRAVAAMAGAGCSPEEIREHLPKIFAEYGARRLRESLLMADNTAPSLASVN